MVDHGIETEKERVHLTKATGKIELDLELKEETFVVKFFDDGSEQTLKKLKGS